MQPDSTVTSSVQPTTARALGVHELHITLIRPTNYTSDGYPIQSMRGVIPSNTLTQMAALIRDLCNYPFFTGACINISLFDEAVDRVPVRKIIKRSRESVAKSIVMLTGVQTNQFPRANDIAARFLPHGIAVLIGGFHVSGMLSMVGETSDLTAAMAKGITLVAGEVEGGRLAVIVEDVVRGQAKQLYNFLNPLPALKDIPTPLLQPQNLRGFARHMATIDTGRGCVFHCEFCTIINVQGNEMRCREPQHVVDFVRQSYHEVGVSFFFFTDDNIARNPRWRELFEGLIHLREKEGIPLTFMMQSDLAARKSHPDFFVLAAQAGCVQSFFGVESVNRDNLRSQGKFQNQVGEYKGLVEHCHEQGIACQFGYILGLPFDTPESIKRDVAELQSIGSESVSFYILTPLPGSKDHQRWLTEEREMDSDFNKYDVTQVTMKPDRMSRAELWQAYCDAWKQFYTTEHMVNLLKPWRHDQRKYWDRITFWMWYLSAWNIEHMHPMSCGFWTVRHRHDRRAGLPIESFIPFWLGEAKRAAVRIVGIVKLYLQFQEVWLRSRPKTKAEEALQELIAKTKGDIVDWRDIKTKELVTLYQKLRDDIPDVKIPSTLGLWLKKHNPLVSSFSRAYVARTWRQWYLHIWNPLKWIEVWLFEWFNGLRFVSHLLSEGRQGSTEQAL